MKKVLLILALLSNLAMIYSQDLKNKLFITGGMDIELKPSSSNLSFTNSHDGYYTHYNITPDIGYYITKKIAMGLQLGYGSTVSTFNSSFFDNFNNPYSSKSTNTMKTLSIAPLVRYTVPITDNLGFNLNLTIPYSFSNRAAQRSSVHWRVRHP